MDTISIVALAIGAIVTLALLALWARSRRFVWGLILGLVVFLTVTIALHAPLHLILLGAGATALGIFLWIVWIGRRLARVAATIALLPLLVLAGCASYALLPSGTPAANAAGSGGTIAFDPEKDFLPTEAKCASNSFVDHSLRTVEPGNSDKKQFSTAVSIPLKGSTDADVTTDMTKNEVCGNPTALDMVVKEMLLWSDKDIPGAEANKAWLNRIKADIDAHSLNSFVERGPSGAAVVTDTYQKYAAWVNTVLLRSVAEGKQSLTSTRNWELSAAIDPTKGLPSVQLASVQEDKPVWVRTYKDKMGTCLLKIGFNVEDRRMEEFDCKPKPAPVAPQEVKPQAQPSEASQPSQSTQTNSGCTQNCGGTACTTCECLGNCVQKCTTCECSNTCAKCTTCTCLGTCPQPCVTNCAKDWSKSVPAPPGVVPQPNDAYEARPNPPANPAPVQPANQAPTSGSQAPGATAPDPTRTQPAAGTGTTSSGSTGSVNPGTGGTGTNTGDPSNPFG